MELINIKNLDKIDAYFIRNLRTNSGDSGKKLANKLNVSKTHLYSAHNGYTTISDQSNEKVLAYYDVAYDQNVSLYNAAYDLVIKTYDCIIFKNNELLAKYEIEFNEKKEKFKYSRGFIFIELIKSIINIIKDKDFSVSMLEKVSRYLSLYDNNIAYIYGIIYVFGKNIGDNLSDIQKVIYGIYNSYPNHNIFPSIKGMFYYQMGRIFYEEKSYLKSLNYYHEAVGYLQKIYCVERVNQVNIEIANILFRLRLYGEAEKKYLELLDEARNNNFKKRINICLNNLSYLYLLQKKYDECEKCIILAKENGSSNNDINYYLAYCTYKTKSKEKTRSVITKLINDENDRYTARMLNLIRGFVNDNENKIDSYFGIIKKYLFNLDDKLEIDMLYEMVISYYLNKNSDKCAKLVEEYLNLSKF